MYDLLAWRAWASNATREEVAEKLALQQDEIVRMREAVRVLAEELRGKCMDRAVNDHWAEELNDEVMNNPIAAAAVRKASDGKEA
jgi:hypothetical protein